MHFLYCLLALLTSSAAFATHISGGYIRVAPVAGQSLTYQITVTMYYNLQTGGAAAGATATLEMCFGENGTTRQVMRSSTRQVPAGQGALSINEYTTTYTYGGAGTYTIQATAISRNSFIRNIASGASGSLPFSLRTIVQVGASLQNQTPVLSLPPTGLVIGTNQRALLALGATDAEGDSVSFGLSLPLTSPSPNEAPCDLCGRFSIITAYQFPNDVNQRGTYRLNPRTGVLNWDVPTEQGQYAAAVLVSEWRNGLLISQTQHEVLITVVDRGGVPVTPPTYEPAQLSLITANPDIDLSGMQLRIAPNPVVGDGVQADLRLDVAQNVTMELVDSQGRVYKTVRFSQPSRQHQQFFDMAGKPAGLYLIRVESGGKQVVQKVLKQ